jgi:hypothetical protein
VVAKPSSSDDPIAGISSGFMDPRTDDPDFHMQHSSVETLGTNVGSYGDAMTALSQKTRAIDMHTLTFGTIGGGLNVAHRSARDSAADALAKGKDVLDSWDKALHDASRNTKQGEDASKLRDQTPPGPKIPTAGGKIPKLDGGGFDKPNLGDQGIGKVNPADFKPSDLKPIDPNAIDPNAVDPNAVDPNAVDPNAIDPNAVDPSAVDPANVDTPNVDPTPIDTPGVPAPDTSALDNALDKAGNTDLAALDQKLPTSNIPNADLPSSSTYDPRNTPTRTSVDNPSSAGMGAATGNAGGQGSIASALNGNRGAPMYPPPMGGAGAGGKEEKERPTGAHVAEDEGVWHSDEDITPAVLGKE